ncbi:MAG TPA: helix-turn-helix domain-containing protein [Candidatus Paceibacterota bacterium]
MALNTAISILGGVTELANAIGVSSQVVTNWRARGRVPAEWCRAVEESTKGGVTRYDLRPDVFGEAPEKAA